MTDFGIPNPTEPQLLAALRWHGLARVTPEDFLMSEEKFDAWAIVEVMGHSRYAGRVSEQQIGGASFVRVDVPEMNVVGRDYPAFTKFLGSSAIFAITPCTEETARRAAAAFRVVPFETFSAPRLTAPHAPADSDYSDDYDDEGPECAECGWHRGDHHANCSHWDKKEANL